MAVSQAFIFGKSQAGSLRFRGFIKFGVSIINHAISLIAVCKFGAFVSFAFFLRV